MSLLFKYINNKVKKARANMTSANDEGHMPEIYAMYNEACKDFKKKTLSRIIKMDYEAGNMMSELKAIEDATKTQLLEARAEKRLDRYIFLTVNPPDDCELKTMINCILKQVNRKFVKNYIFCFEQRGKTKEEMGKGKHIHLLFERNINYKPAIIKRDLKNGFKKCFKNNIGNMNNNVFNFKKCGKEYYDERKKYIKGNKEGADKKAKMSIDAIWRQAHGLGEYTTCDNELSITFN